MNRDNRLAYLQEMGIEPWLPIKILPGAEIGHWVAPFSVGSSESHQLQTANPEHKVPDMPTSPLSPYPSANRESVLAKVLDFTDLPSTSFREKAASSLSPGPAASKVLGGVVKSKSLDSFTLACTVCGDLLIIDDISRMTFAGSAYQHWINAILLSLGKQPLSDITGLQDRFEWPLPESGLFEHNQQAASDICAAWLQRKLQENSVHWILLMGKAAVSIQADAGLGVVTSLASNSSESELSVQVLPTYGSGKLWREPLLKCEFWQHIQPLRAVANNPAT